MSDRADIPDEELIATAMAGALLDVHTALPGIVKSYDAAKGTCDVLPAIKRALEREDGSTSYESLPVIHNVRVCWPGAGGFELHLPLAAGDTVWLMFAEVDTQQWESTGQESPPGWLARHGLGSCVAYPFSRTPKATMGGACMVTPNPFSFGNPAAAKLVAIAEKVDALGDTIKTWANGHTHIATSFGSPSAVAVPLLGALAPTAATKLKAE